MGSSYDSTHVDSSAIRQLARLVAAETAATPLTHQKVEWFGKDNRQFRADGPAVSGWVVATLVEESAIDDHSWESGWEFFLRTDGELMSANFWRQVPNPPRERSPYAFEPMTDGQMTYLDRPNRGDFQPTKPGRQELKARYVLEATFPGEMLSTALQSLRHRAPTPATQRPKPISPSPSAASIAATDASKMLLQRSLLALCLAVVTAGIYWVVTLTAPTASDHDSDETYLPNASSVITLIVLSLVVALFVCFIVDVFVGEGNDLWFVVGFVLGIVYFFYKIPWNNLDHWGGQMFPVLRWWVPPTLGVLLYCSTSVVKRLRHHAT